MRNFPTTPIGMLASIWCNRNLIYASSKRDIVMRYKGSFLGLLWSFLNPLLLLAIYTFVFSEVFNARWRNESQSKIEFGIVLFAGLIIYNLFAECINRSPSLIVGNPNYVKKVVYPLEVLPVIGLLSALYHALISFCIWLIAYFIYFGLPHATTFFLPLILIPLSLFTVGISWILASLGVFLRDVSQVVGVLTTALMFLSPIFYPASVMPEKYRFLLNLNPLTPMVEMTRDLLYWGRVPSLMDLAFFWGTTIIVAMLGFIWFQKTRKGFADVL